MRTFLFCLLVCLLLVGCKTITEIDPATGEPVESIVVDPEATEKARGILDLIGVVTGTWIPELVLLGYAILAGISNIKLKKGARATATAVDKLKASNPKIGADLLVDLKAGERAESGLLKAKMPDKV